MIVRYRWHYQLTLARMRLRQAACACDRLLALARSLLAAINEGEMIIEYRWHYQPSLACAHDRLLAHAIACLACDSLLALARSLLAALIEGEMIIGYYSVSGSNLHWGVGALTKPVCQKCQLPQVCRQKIGQPKHLQISAKHTVQVSLIACICLRSPAAYLLQ